MKIPPLIKTQKWPNRLILQKKKGNKIKVSFFIFISMTNHPGSMNKNLYVWHFTVYKLTTSGTLGGIGI